MLGRYVNPTSYGPLIIQAIKNEIASFYATTGLGSLKAFGYLFAGSIELMQEGQDLSYVKIVLEDFMHAVQDSVVDSLDIETSSVLVETIDVMTTEMIKKRKEGVDISIVQPHLA